jgi:hypothetical protein
LNFPQSLGCTALSPNVFDHVTDGFLVIIQEQKEKYNRDVDESQDQVCISDLGPPDEKEDEESATEKSDKKARRTRTDEVQAMFHIVPISKSQRPELKARLLYKIVKLFNGIHFWSGTHEKAIQDNGGPNDVKSLANESKGFEILQRRVWTSQQFFLDA